MEHLEEIDDAGVRALAAAGTVANLLPGAVLTLRLRWPDARRLLAAAETCRTLAAANPSVRHYRELALAAETNGRWRTSVRYKTPPVRCGSRWCQTSTKTR